MNNSVGNSFTLQDNGVKVVKADFCSILTPTKRIRLGDATPAFAYFVCGFFEEIHNYERFGMTPHVTLYKTEAEVQEYCKGKVVGYSEYYANSEEEIDQLIANNKKLQESHARSLYETY